MICSAIVPFWFLHIYVALLRGWSIRKVSFNGGSELLFYFIVVEWVWVGRRIMVEAGRWLVEGGCCWLNGAWDIWYAIQYHVLLLFVQEEADDIMLLLLVVLHTMKVAFTYHTHHLSQLYIIHSPNNMMMHHNIKMNNKSKEEAHLEVLNLRDKIQCVKTHIDEKTSSWNASHE